MPESSPSNWFKHLINPAVVGGFALLGSYMGVYGGLREQEAQHHQDIIVDIMEFDSKDNRKVVNILRVMHDLDILDEAKIQRVHRRFTHHPHTAPRFYHSAFIWSVFYPDVEEIKRAYHQLGIYGKAEDEVAINGDVDAEFVSATALFQQCACEFDFRDQPDFLKESCIRKRVDGIFGINTMRRLAAIPLAGLYGWSGRPASDPDKDADWCPGLLRPTQ